MSKKRHAFISEAILIRRLHSYRDALSIAGASWLPLSDHDLGEFAVIPSADDIPSYSDLSRRYDRLLDEWVQEPPHDIEGAIAYLELVAQIIVGELQFRFQEEAGPIPTEKDFLYALELVSRVRNWLNEKDLALLAREERAKREAQP